MRESINKTKAKEIKGALFSIKRIFNRAEINCVRKFEYAIFLDKTLA